MTCLTHKFPDLQYTTCVNELLSHPLAHTHVHRYGILTWSPVRWKYTQFMTTSGVGCVPCMRMIASLTDLNVAGMETTRIL